MPLRLSGLSSGMDTDGIVKELMKAQNLKKTKIENKITKTQWKQDKWKDLNTKLYSFYTGALTKIRLQGSFNTKKVSSSDESKATVSVTNTAPEGTHSLKIQQLASSQFVTGEALGTDKNGKAITADTKLIDLNMTSGTGNKITVTSGTTSNTLTISDTTTVADFLKTLKDTGLNANYDTVQKRFFISSKTSGSDNAFSLTTAGSVDLSKLGLNTFTSNGDGTFNVSGVSLMALVAPKDAKVVYNDTELTSSSNVISVNGLTITLKGVTEGAGTLDPSDDKPISIGVQKDNQAVYDTVKDFVKKYNELITEMNKDYSADSSAGYDPLTDEQKQSMTDDQITKWEAKIKDSLMRRDDTLGTLIDTMRSKLGENVKLDGKNYSLATFGIGSVNYSEKGLLHINGDKDDSLVSAMDDKLMKAINEDPDKVMTVLNSVADDLYSDLSDKMKSSKLRSALTLYNDKELNNQVTDYKDELSKLEVKLKDMEDRYYKQFSAMEAAMSKMNSQSSSLAGMLGK